MYQVYKTVRQWLMRKPNLSRNVNNFIEFKSKS